MKYQYLRIFLTEVERQPDLFEEETVRLSRSDYLKAVFTRRIDFMHRKRPFVFIPIGQQEAEGGIICLGRVGREVAELVNRPPEENFADYEATSWRAANLLVDTRSDPTGQKVAHQYRTDVGKGLPIMNSLAEHVNIENRDSGWDIEVNSMTTKEGFWDKVKEYKGELTEVEFEFVTPNVLQIKNKLNKELKQANINENAKKVSVSYKNKDGNLRLDTQEVKDAHEVISEGGGKAKLKSGKKSIYDSSKDEKVKLVDEDEPLNSIKTETWKRISDILF